MTDGRFSTAASHARPYPGGRASSGAVPLVADEPGFDFASPAYAALFENSAATAFQHPIWLDRAYRRLLPSTGAEPLVVTIRAPEDGRLLGVLPLVKCRHRGRTVVESADFGVTDYAAPVCDVNAWTAIRGDPAIPRLIRRALGSYDLLRLAKFREDCHDMAELLGRARRFASGPRTQSRCTRLSQSGVPNA